jgi:hypothetical protein
MFTVMIGETFFMVEDILRDVKQGVGMCLFDSEGSAIESIIDRLPEHVIPRVVLLEPLDDEEYVFGLNLFECDPNDSKQVANTVTYILALCTRLFVADEYPTLGPDMEDLLRNIALTMIANPGQTMQDIPHLLTNAAARQRLVQNVSDPRVRLHWDIYNQLDPLVQQAQKQFILSKLQKLLADPHIRLIVGQSKTTVDFSKLLDTGSILLVKLSQGHWQLACIVCYAILCKFVNAALARSNAQKQKEPESFRFYADGYIWQHLMLQQE